MDIEIVKTAGQVAGIGGVSIGALVLIYRDVIAKNIFPSLSKVHAFSLLRLLIILSWSVAISGIAAWAYVTTKSSGYIVSAFSTEPLHEEIPEEELPDVVMIGGSNSLEITGISYSRTANKVDVRVRNIGTNSVILNRIYMYVQYLPAVGAAMKATDTIDTGISDSELQRTKNKREVLSIRKGYKVSYAIEPNGFDRYLFDLPITPDNLYYPESGYGGEYQLIINIDYNKDEVVGESVDVRQLF